MDKDVSKFKAPNGSYLTQSLFHEFANNKEYVIYSVANHDVNYKGRVIPSLKKLYLEMEDPTEYLFAQKYLCDWDHWQRLCTNAVLMRNFAQWRDELNVRLRAKGVAGLLRKAEEGDRQASQWLAERKFDPNAVGRPKKKEKDLFAGDDGEGNRILSLVKEVNGDG